MVTELRGAQEGSNSLPDFVEIANVGDEVVDLQGLRVHFVRLDGGSELDLIVRARRELAPGAYFTFGFVPDATRPLHIDYGVGDAYSGGLYPDGVLELHACDDVIDRLVYQELPAVGTWSLGLSPPDAEGNDSETSWCVDDEPPPPGPQTSLGIPGTPGEANRTCV